ncbi:zinc ribbon domain-containing protein [Paenibacillus sp. EPM92]|uniref:zinc ribbon domain-containing protein n=1 Tax=Paenibacillus sp. EPM92 TaxID=1561195 RepID=UPI001916117D|nr:zinc ribbon domain-containing protein [Paenibacillus sp. EPM92]
MEFYICPICKSKNDEHQKYCTQCGTWLLSDRFPAQKVKKGTTWDKLYVCAFCDTANEPNRNACKKCLKPLFSTDYETKEIKVARVALVSKVFKIIVYALSGLIVLFGLLTLIIDPNNRPFAISATLILLCIIQLIFGIINPSIIPGKIASRKKVLATYGIALIVLFTIIGKVSQPSTGSKNISAISTGAKISEDAAIATTEKKETEDQFKESAKKMPYVDLARNPDKFKGERLTFDGQVIQVLEQGNNVALRVNVTKGDYGIWEDTIFVNYRRQNGEDRILEKDVITIWGVAKGLKTYKTVLGSETSLPELDASYIKIADNKK